jgi:hypothetical protein
MKHPLLSRWLRAVGLLLTMGAAACTKHATDPQPLPRTGSALSVAPTVDQVHRWYDSLAQVHPTSLPLNWSQALTVGNAVVLPFQETTNLFGRSPGQGYRCLLVTRGVAAGFAGTLVELVLPDNSLSAATAPIVAQQAYAHYYQQAQEPMPLRDGQVRFYSLAYEYQAGYVYRAGAAPVPAARLVLATRLGTAAPQSARSSAAPQDLSSPPATTPNLLPCTPIATDWYNGSSGDYITTTYDFSNCQGA